MTEAQSHMEPDMVFSGRVNAGLLIPASEPSQSLGLSHLFVCLGVPVAVEGVGGDLRLYLAPSRSSVLRCAQDCHLLPLQLCVCGSGLCVESGACNPGTEWEALPQSETVREFQQKLSQEDPWRGQEAPGAAGTCSRLSRLCWLRAPSSEGCRPPSVRSYCGEGGGLDETGETFMTFNSQGQGEIQKSWNF